VSRFVTCHGMAINIQNDLSIFDFMVPCGLDGVQMTSVQKETGKTHNMEQIKMQLGRLLVRHVGCASPHDPVAWARAPTVQDHGQDARATGRKP
jgi:lipoate-protein ligase B